MRGIKHHMIDFVDPSEEYSVADYVRDASKAIDDIISRGKIPVLCGGTGLYFNSLIDNVRFSDVGKDEKYRAQLKLRAETEGAQSLLDELAQYDPESARRLHPNNLSRIIRAMEHYKLSGVTISEQNRQSRLTGSRYEPLILLLDFKERRRLYDRINARTDKMLNGGLLDETEYFYSHYPLRTASAAIGYKELKPYLDGEISLFEAAENLKRETRRYAKRQLTWFRRESRARTIYADALNTQSVLGDAVKIIEESNFLL